jgi:hypothetical protein
MAGNSRRGRWMSWGIYEAQGVDVDRQTLRMPKKSLDAAGADEASITFAPPRNTLNMHESHFSIK